MKYLVLIAVVAVVFGCQYKGKEYKDKETWVSLE